MTQTKISGAQVNVSLDDLSDVQAATPSSDSLFRFDGTEWVSTGPNLSFNGTTSLTVGNGTGGAVQFAGAGNLVATAAVALFAGTPTIGNDGFGVSAIASDSDGGAIAGNILMTAGNGSNGAIGGSVIFTAGTTGNPSSDGSISFSTGGSPRLLITGAGGWQVDGSEGNSGQVLTSDGQGSTPYWGTPAAGGGGAKIQTFTLSGDTSSFGGAMQGGFLITEVYTPSFSKFVDANVSYTGGFDILISGNYRITLVTTIITSGLPNGLSSFGTALRDDNGTLLTGGAFGSPISRHTQMSSTTPNIFSGLTGASSLDADSAATRITWTDVHHVVLTVGSPQYFVPATFAYSTSTPGTIYTSNMIMTIEKLN